MSRDLMVLTALAVVECLLMLGFWIYYRHKLPEIESNLKSAVRNVQIAMFNVCIAIVMLLVAALRRL